MPVSTSVILNKSERTEKGADLPYYPTAAAELSSA